MENDYPKRLIEVDLPIRRISAHARREKSIRHGHISTLHIWWARRPLAACRAVICASLWPDPADAHCQEAFRETAERLMLEWTDHERQALLSADSRPRFEAARKNRKLFNDPVELRKALLDFIADFANWDNSISKPYLDTTRALTQSAHEALGGEAGTRPLVVDPFAGGGAIPLEALRVGADAFASDLNPVAVLLNKVVLEYIPKYGQKLADEVKKRGQWIKEEVEKELAEFYPKDPDGATPIAYLWARTIQCEGPGCGAEVPLMRSLWLAKKVGRAVALRMTPRPQLKRVDFEIIENARGADVGEGTVARGSATCPICGFTTHVKSVRAQLKKRHGGADDARLFCVVTTQPGQKGRFYRLPTDRDLDVVKKASKELEKREKAHKGELSLVPEEETPSQRSHRSVSSCQVYGMDCWRDLFVRRQALSLVVLKDLIGAVSTDGNERDFAEAISVLLSFAFGKQADLSNSLCRWEPNAQCPRNLFGRQALPMVWDFAEAVPTGESSGAWGLQIRLLGNALDRLEDDWREGSSTVADATAHPLPDDASDVFFTDPPYYDAIPYGEISDFFYVWQKRIQKGSQAPLFEEHLTDKKRQAIVWHPQASQERLEYEHKMMLAMGEGRRTLKPSGLGVVVFAHKSTSGWEAQLQAMLQAGWIVTGSWPIDTECGSRMNAMGTATLASSVHIVMRPRENPDGSVVTERIGEWRDVLAELPPRIGSWLPRLAAEGVVGADAIFACLGPALEIFSRYSSVEKTGGDKVELREYLEHVWGEVAKQALTMIFEGADTAGLEEDARLTAMWLWTLRTDAEADSDTGEKVERIAGYELEYDAARKIAQGLGCHLENLAHLVAVQGDKATLLSASSRARYLFGKDDVDVPKKRGEKKSEQGDLFAALELPSDEEISHEQAELDRPAAGSTVLDQLHQVMILFGASRGQALKRFLVDDGVGNSPQLWSLAQSLSALYPPQSEEKRWVDGVLARKKGLGF